MEEQKTCVCPTRVKTVTVATEKQETQGTVVYWLTKNQRVENNWSLVFAQNLAIKQKKPLVVVYNLLHSFPRATQRQYSFMIGGLADMRTKLAALDIPFALYKGRMATGIKSCLWGFQCSHLVMDHDVVHLSASWKDDVLKDLPKHVTSYTVDGTNLVPAWEVSDQSEPTESAFRTKIESKFQQYLVPVPTLQKHPYKLAPGPKDLKLKAAAEHSRMDAFTAKDLIATWYQHLDTRVEECSWATPGQEAGMAHLKRFIEEELPTFAENRQFTKTTDILSSYLFWGQISSQAAALAIAPYSSKHPKSVAAFFDEFIVRREFAIHRMQHSKMEGSDESTLYPAFTNEHWHNKSAGGKTVFSRAQLENGQTNDQVWNALQKEMADNGTMCGFAHKYWARKILEWSATPEDAFKTALYLKDKYILAYRCAWGHDEIDRSMGCTSTEPVVEVERRMEAQFQVERERYEGQIAAIKSGKPAPATAQSTQAITG